MNFPVLITQQGETIAVAYDQSGIELAVQEHYDDTTLQLFAAQGGAASFNTGLVCDLEEITVYPFDELVEQQPSPEVAKLVEALEGFLAIVADSTGVSGYHLNGNIAKWSEFEEVTMVEEALALYRQRGGELTSTPLLTALRQYSHNNGEGFVFGYDKAETDRIVAGFIEDRNQQYTMKCKALEQRDKLTAPEGEPVGFCEDTALSLAERTFSTEVDEQLAEDVIQYARRLHNRYTAPQPVPEVAKLVEALEQVIKAAPSSGPLWHGSEQIVEARVALRKQGGRIYD